MKAKKYIPILILVLGFLIVYFSGLLDYLSFETLKMHRKSIVSFVSERYFLSSLGFIFLYILAIAFSIPGGVFLTILGGFLFPQPLSTIYVVFSATIGATLLFLAAKTAFRDFFEKKVSKGFLKKMEKGFQENGSSYLLFLRFIPLFPFWLVNLAPAFFGASLWTFVWTTFVGIIPGSFVYAQTGAGLGAILDTDKPFSLDAIFNWKMRIALICLALLSLTPIIVKKMKKKHDR